VHLNIEARLTQLVGDAGKRLHTGRSRNDQVATDVRLWLRGEIDLIGDLLKELQVRWSMWRRKRRGDPARLSPTCRWPSP
jgi:argininosuccinate lyase